MSCDPPAVRSSQAEVYRVSEFGATMPKACWFWAVMSVGAFSSLLIAPRLMAVLCAAAAMDSRGMPQIHSCAAAATATAFVFARPENGTKLLASRRRPGRDEHCCSSFADSFGGCFAPSAADNKHKSQTTKNIRCVFFMSVTASCPSSIPASLDMYVSVKSTSRFY